MAITVEFIFNVTPVVSELLSPPCSLNFDGSIVSEFTVSEKLSRIWPSFKSRLNITNCGLVSSIIN